MATKKKMKHEHAMAFTVEAGMGASVPIPVEQGSVLAFHVNSSSEIYLTYQYLNERFSNQNAPHKWTKAESNTIWCEHKGVLQFDFGNQSSWFTSALISFDYTLFLPLSPALERAYSCLLSAEGKESELVLDCSKLSTEEILASGRRFWGFTSAEQCREKIGRSEVDFASEEDLVQYLGADNLHAFLLSSSHHHAKDEQQHAAALLQVQLGSFIFENLPREVCKEIVEYYVANMGQESGAEIDTARSYGKAEEIVGELLAQLPANVPRIPVSTKVNPFPYSGKALDAASIRRQVRESLDALRITKCKVLYLHQPDNQTELECTLAEMNRLHKEEGAMFELGLSNYPAWQVVLIYHTCLRNNWVVPTVYQGVYNVLVREVEQELFPALRAHNMRFVAYNPLAGGLLTGKHHAFAEAAHQSSGRFARGSQIGDRYLERYWHESTFQALQVLRTTCSRCGLEMTDLAFRWLVCHSALDASRGDGMVLGASTLAHLQQNLALVREAKPLPQVALDAIQLAWKVCRLDSPKYFRV